MLFKKKFQNFFTILFQILQVYKTIVKVASKLDDKQCTQGHKCFEFLYILVKINANPILIIAKT